MTNKFKKLLLKDDTIAKFEAITKDERDITNSKSWFIVDLENVIVPLLMRRLWVKMILKYLAVSDDC